MKISGIKKVDIFSNGKWEATGLGYLETGDVFRIHRDDETIIDKNIWVATDIPYIGIDFKTTSIKCEEFKGELEEVDYMDEFCGYVKSLDDRITALEENKNNASAGIDMQKFKWQENSSQEIQKIIEDLWDEENKKHIAYIVELDEELKKYNKIIEAKIKLLEEFETSNDKNKIKDVLKQQLENQANEVISIYKEMFKKSKEEKQEIVDEIYAPISPKGISAEHLMLLKNECILPNSAIEKLSKNLKTLEETLGVTNNKISNDPIVLNITIDNINAENDTNKLLEQIIDGLKKFGK